MAKKLFQGRAIKARWKKKSNIYVVKMRYCAKKGKF